MPTDGLSPPPPPASPTGQDRLFSRTYVGLLIAQFLAAFNDQAIHAAGMFYAINTQTLSEAQAISLMPILFYAPWALFCTLAGYLSDKYSKQRTLLGWKVAEVAICGIAVFGFWLGTDAGSPRAGAWIVLSTVFLMGTHSAFFVPAKYGVMPEILPPHLLSRGNGLLESLSFLAVILGTVSGGVMSFVFLRRETNIGLVLLGLAVLGALAALLIRRMPAANPSLGFPPYVFGPLYRNLKTLLTSRPLCFAVIGIAFFTFVVAFMRATVYMFGESQNPRWDELKTSMVVGTVALGVGLGSPLAGYLSGRKVELGLIPLGALGMVFGCVLAGFSLGFIPGFVTCTILIGVSTGFYLVPLFTLLQHRAPKSSKGDMVASSNFINVTGAIAASVLFALLVNVAKAVEFIPRVEEQDRVAAGTLEDVTFVRGRPVQFKVGDLAVGTAPDTDRPFDLWDHLFGDKPPEVRPEIEMDRTLDKGEASVVSKYTLRGVDHYYLRPAESDPKAHYDARHLPRFLFLGAGVMTFGVFLLLWRRVRDLPQRARTVLFGPRFVPEGLARVPGDGPVVLIIESDDPGVIRAARSAVDRHVEVFEPKSEVAKDVEAAHQVLARGDVVGVFASSPAATEFTGHLEGLHLRVRVEGQMLIFE
jgi:MFS family permease